MDGGNIVSEQIAANPSNPYTEIHFRTGLTATSTTATVEPNQFGDTGMLLATFRLANVTRMKGAGSIVSLRLVGELSASTSGTGANKVYVKIGARFNGSNTVRFTPTQQVTGPTPTKLYYDFDLMPYLADFVDGDCFGAIAVWGEGSNATKRIGNGAVSDPNASFSIIVGVC